MGSRDAQLGQALNRGKNTLPQLEQRPPTSWADSLSSGEPLQFSGR
jgi:hypothetical protein